VTGEELSDEELKDHAPDPDPAFYRRELPNPGMELGAMLREKNQGQYLPRRPHRKPTSFDEILVPESLERQIENEEEIATTVAVKFVEGSEIYSFDEWGIPLETDGARTSLTGKAQLDAFFIEQRLQLSPRAAEFGPDTFRRIKDEVERKSGRETANLGLWHYIVWTPKQLEEGKIPPSQQLKEFVWRLNQLEAVEIAFVKNRPVLNSPTPYLGDLQVYLSEKNSSTDDWVVLGIEDNDFWVTGARDMGLWGDGENLASLEPVDRYHEDIPYPHAHTYSNDINKYIQHGTSTYGIMAANVDSVGVDGIAPLADIYVSGHNTRNRSMIDQLTWLMNHGDWDTGTANFSFSVQTKIGDTWYYGPLDVNPDDRDAISTFSSNGNTLVVSIGNFMGDIDDVDWDGTQTFITGNRGDASYVDSYAIVVGGVSHIVDSVTGEAIKWAIHSAGSRADIATWANGVATTSAKEVEESGYVEGWVHECNDKTHRRYNIPESISNPVTCEPAVCTHEYVTCGFGGTSAAAPQVAGFITLMKQFFDMQCGTYSTMCFESWHAKRARDFLVESALPISDSSSATSGVIPTELGYPLRSS
jgi:hypothetical protein